MRVAVIHEEQQRRVGLVVGLGVVDLAVVIGARRSEISFSDWPDDYRNLHQHRALMSQIEHELATQLEEGNKPDGWLGSLEDLHLDSPVLRPGKILCVGLNYADHVAEVGLDTPARPHVFSKLRTALNGPYDPVVVPWDITTDIDYEVELAMVVGSEGKNIPEDKALEHILGYTVANDISARDWQFAADDQLTLGKGFDGFLPLGPYIVIDEVAEPANLPVRCWVDGELRQESSTAEMIASPAEIVSFLSRICTLAPGDVIATGTPAGVGWGRKPKALLSEGQLVVAEIEGVGSLKNRIE